MEENLIVSHSPHIAGKDSLKSIMLQVIIAMLPALVAGCLVFGFRALVVTLICVVSCVVFEGLWQKVLKKPLTVSDLSAVVTGMLLAFNLPAGIPLWIPVIGSFFAIIIVKQFFGGIGHNFMNPALAARAFLLASWALAMTTWPAPGANLPLFGSADAVSSTIGTVDALTTATPLALYAAGAENLPSYLTLFLGNTGGCIGETSALAILIGGIYLLSCGVIRLRVPVSFIATVAVGTWIFGGQNGFFTGDWLYQILSGGLMLGAFFMATDYATTPFTPKGQIIFGIGCGVITVVIRLWGGYPEGVSYSILLMNIVTPLIDKITAPRRYGTSMKKEAA